MKGMPLTSSGDMNERPNWLYEPTTATAPSSTARWAQCAAVTESLCSLQVSTFRWWPRTPPRELTQRA